MVAEPRGSLPQNCAACVYRPSELGFCQRNPPSPTSEAFEITRWPLVKPTDRCGAGAAVGDGTGPSVTGCAWCIHWLQPEGQGIEPDYRQGLPRAWWEQSGYCTKLAPSPSAEEDRKTYWRVTGAHDGCGEGERIPMQADE